MRGQLGFRPVEGGPPRGILRHQGAAVNGHVTAGRKLDDQSLVDQHNSTSIFENLEGSIRIVVFPSPILFEVAVVGGVQNHVMVTRDDQFELVRLLFEPSSKTLDFRECAPVGQVTCVHKDVTRRDVKEMVEVVSV
eukprot:Lithocolla_globosa_v1_NODE_8986_length_760_cov_2.903546.p2 type:complete len:136 gc:universal NODE_8986_length_760_cov_2.903546:255-662(+)